MERRFRLWTWWLVPMAVAAVVFGLAMVVLPDAWWLIAVSVLVWFVPDTAYSVQAGFWQNAVLNVEALVLFATPLAATYGAYRARGSHRTRAST